MSTDLVRFQRQAFRSPKLEDFWWISDFGSSTYSFYQAINIAIIEALIKYKTSSDKISALKSQYYALIAHAFTIHKRFNSETDYMASFSHMLDQMLTPNLTLEQSLKMCNDYTITNDINSIYPFFYSMLCIFLSLFEGNQEIEKKIKESDHFSIQDMLLNALVCKLDLKISLHTADDSKIFISSKAREGPSIHIFSNNGNFSILYSKYVVDSNSNFFSPIDWFIQEVSEVISLPNLLPQVKPIPELPKLLEQNFTKEELHLQLKNVFEAPKAAPLNLPQINSSADKSKEISQATFELPKIINYEPKKSEQTYVQDINSPPKIQLSPDTIKLHQMSINQTISPNLINPTINNNSKPPNIIPPTINPPNSAARTILAPPPNINPPPSIIPPSNSDAYRPPNTIVPPNFIPSSYVTPPPSVTPSGNNFVIHAPDAYSPNPNNPINLGIHPAQIPPNATLKNVDVYGVPKFEGNQAFIQGAYNIPNRLNSPGQFNNESYGSLFQCSSCHSQYDAKLFKGFSCECVICYNCRKQYHGNFCSFCGKPYTDQENNYMQKHRKHY